MQTKDTRIERLLQWRAGGTAAPWSISLYPTNRCNFRCPICWQRNPSLRLEHKDELPDERYLSLVDEAADAGVREWSILGGGEPLVRGELIMQLCEKIRHRSMSGYIQTNGSLLNTAYLERLVAARFNGVRVSLDGPTAAINDAIRNEASFERATANLKKLAEIKKRVGSDVPVTSLYMVITSLAYDKLDQMVEYAASVGAAGIEASTLIVHSEEGRPFQLDEQQRAALPTHLERAIKRAEELGIQTNFPMLFREEITANPNAMFSGKQSRSGDLLDAPCFMPWLNMVVVYNGSAGPCCMYDCECTSEDDNIGKRSLMQVWHGSYFERLRTRMLEGRMPAYCATCPSSLFAEQDAVRREATAYLNRDVAPTEMSRRLSWIVGKGVRSLRQYGLRGAFRRGQEWLEIRRRGHGK